MHLCRCTFIPKNIYFPARKEVNNKMLLLWMYLNRHDLLSTQSHELYAILEMTNVVLNVNRYY